MNTNCLRWLPLALAVIVLLLGSGCSAKSPAVDVVGYVAPPVSKSSAQSTPAASAIRRPTHVPLAARQGATTVGGQTGSGGAANSAVDTTADKGGSALDPAVAAVPADPLSTPEAFAPTTVDGNTSQSPRARRSTRVATPGHVPGEVDASVGRFVTSDSRSTRYFYARADARWHQIRAIHQKWFASVEDLLKAYPNRVPRPPRSRPTLAPSTPTPTLTG